MKFFTQIRCISTTSKLLGKRNFRKFIIPNRGTNIFKERQKTNPDPDVPPYPWLPKKSGYFLDGKFVTVPERLPELVVPDLTDFNLKPYVSYRAADVVQEEFTPKDLFDVVYSKKIVEDLASNKLTAEGEPIEPSAYEMQTVDEAWTKARQTGSDLFVQRSRREEEELYFN